MKPSNSTSKTSARDVNLSRQTPETPPASSAGKAPLSICPYMDRHCSQFFQYLEGASPSLAGRTREFYCHGRFGTCARYRICKQQGEAHLPTHLGPWNHS